MKAQIAFADDDSPFARRLLVRPSEVFDKADTDFYFSRVFTTLNGMLNFPKDFAH